MHSPKTQPNRTREFQSLDNKPGRKSRRWKIMFLLVFMLILAAGGLWAVLPAQESKWPTMPVFVVDQNVARAAERLADDNAISARNAERTLDRMLRGRDGSGRLNDDVLIWLNI